MSQHDDKRIAAEAAVAEVADGMLVGLGTGSTAAFLIAELGRRALRIEAVATSDASAALAAAHGIRLRDMTGIAQLDLAIDGVDEIDPQCRAIKGAGGAMLREKIVAAAARRMVVIADGSKAVARLGQAALPIEVLPFAAGFVAEAVAALGATVATRGGATPTRTDQGNHILECRFAALPEPEWLARALSAIPGMLGHGLFLHEIDAAYVARDGAVERRERAAG